MLAYNDFNGFILGKYLNFPQLPSIWLIFRKDNIDEIVLYLLSEFSQDKYFVLNHESYKVMNKRLMTNNGAIGLANLHTLKVSRVLSQQPISDKNIFNDLFFVNNQTNYSDFKKYLYKIFDTDFGFFLKENAYNSINYIDINKIISDIKSKNIENIFKVLDIIGFFIDYDDLYYGLCILGFNQTAYFPEYTTVLNLEEMQKINTIYNCKLAGNFKI